MPFGIIGRTGPWMSHVMWFGVRSMGRGTLGANLGCVIVTNEDLGPTFAATRPSSQITLGRLVRLLATIITSISLAVGLTYSSPIDAQFFSAADFNP